MMIEIALAAVWPLVLLGFLFVCILAISRIFRMFSDVRRVLENQAQSRKESHETLEILRRVEKLASRLDGNDAQDR
ncbi:hypothetical protein HQ520_14785 [bacterium]|nr:hypothetical protein [bacterium]